MQSSQSFRIRPLLAAACLAFVLFAGACGDQGQGAGSTTASSPTMLQERQSPAATPSVSAVASPQEASAGATAGTSRVASPQAPTARIGAATESVPASPTAPNATPTAATPPDSRPDLSGLRISLAPVAIGLSNPLYVTNAGDGSGHLFIVEKTGAIRVVEGGRLLDKPFLDISDRVNSSGSEQGLLGLAFPPDYARRRFFFVDYIDRDGNTMISRFNVTGDPDVADPASEFLVLKIEQPAPNHNGGDLVFGPDGYLWIGTGDGGSEGDPFGNGQNPDTLLAKMLRIDVTSDPTKPYLIPRDNPSVAQKWQVLPEIWATGLRNPWRYSFDRANGDLWIADVGQNRIEEIDVVRAGSKGGLNFGWSIMEGPSCYRQPNCDQSGLVLPVASYEHGANGCSVTGGYVYRGRQFPSLNGVYLFGDYCSGRIWGLDAARPGQPQLLLESGSGLSSFGEDEAGEVYLTNLSDGTVSRVVVQ